MAEQKRYQTKLPKWQVDNYYKVLNMSKEAWFALSDSARVQAAWHDMYMKQQAAHEAAEQLKQLEQQ